MVRDVRGREGTSRQDDEVRTVALCTGGCHMYCKSFELGKSEER